MKILGFLFSSTLILLILSACGGSSSCSCGFYEVCRNDKCECIDGYSELWGSCVQYTRPYDNSYYGEMQYVYVVDNPPSGNNLEQTIFAFTSPTPDNIRQYFQNGQGYSVYLRNPSVYKYNYYEFAFDDTKATRFTPVNPNILIDSSGNLVLQMNYGYYSNSYGPNTAFFKQYNLGANERLLVDVTATSSDNFLTFTVKFDVSKDISNDYRPDELLESFEAKYVQR